MSIVCLQANELFSAANQTASEAFAAIRTVAAFSLQAPLGTLYEKLLEKPQASASFGFCNTLVSKLAILWDPSLLLAASARSMPFTPLPHAEC